MPFQSQNSQKINRSYVSHLTKTKTPATTLLVSQPSHVKRKKDGVCWSPIFKTDSERPHYPMSIGKQRNEIVSAMIKQEISHGTKSDLSLTFQHPQIPLLTPSRFAHSRRLPRSSSEGCETFRSLQIHRTRSCMSVYSWWKTPSSICVAPPKVHGSMIHFNSLRSAVRPNYTEHLCKRMMAISRAGFCRMTTLQQQSVIQVTVHTCI